MSVLAPNSHILLREVYCSSNKDREQQHHLLSGGSYPSSQRHCWWRTQRGSGFLENQKIVKRKSRVAAFFPDFTRPTFVEMESINDMDQMDQILQRSAELSQSVIIDWMATWCRKCIYLKPKLEKLAAEYDTKVKFYYVDVNKVPQALVKRGNISKMPTIQLWKDGEMKAEVIGGHKAWLVLDEVREMIQKFV